MRRCVREYPSYTPIEEIDAHRHPILPNSQDYDVVRCIYDFDQEHNQNSVTLTLVDRVSGDRRCLRFSGVKCEHPLKGCPAVYILDVRHRQWDRIRVEVGEFYEEGGVCFLAETVEIVESVTM